MPFIRPVLDDITNVTTTTTDMMNHVAGLLSIPNKEFNAPAMFRTAVPNAAAAPAPRQNMQMASTIW